MQRPSERQLARGAYNWLRVSPILTIPTLLVLVQFGASLPCSISTQTCNSGYESLVGGTIGVLGSGLWHLQLLQYVYNKESEFVRKHGNKAIQYAGIRTAIAFGFVLLEFFTSWGGSIAWGVLILFIMWAVNTRGGLREIEKELGPLEKDTQLVSPRVENLDDSMPENDKGSREHVLDELLKALQGDDAVNRRQAITRLKEINYSSEAIRLQLERLALHDENIDVRKEALASLDLSTQRNVQSRISTMDRNGRQLILDEISGWEKNGLLEKQTAEVIRKRYDFDLMPPPAPRPAPAQPVVAAREAIQPAPLTSETAPPKPHEPAGPRPTLLQTLLSETSIKIALYLGAFFVIASAVILGALVEAARLPVLIAATLIFGGLAVVIRKRLPQPSFALFIVFSFLLPITANVVEEWFDLSLSSSAAYWVFVSLFMAIVWAGSTWLYESRLFSLTTFVSAAIALYRVGDIFQAGPEFYATMSGLSALGGLAGARTLKKWKDSNFALPLFLAAQAVQGIVLVASMIIFGAKVLDPSSTPLWHLASVFTLGFAFAFYAISESLFPFIFFPWLAALTLIPVPWFLAAALDIESLGSSIISLIWGLILSPASEFAHHIDIGRKYSLPVLISSIPTFALAVVTGFAFSMALGLAVSFGVAVIYGVLHFVRARGWLWALALFNFIIAYFAFFSLPAIERTNIYSGYQLLILSLIFLLPDLFLKNDLRANLAWRLPPRIYAALVVALVFAVFGLAQEKPLINTAAIFGVYAVFFAIYGFKYQQPLIGYLSTIALPISAIYALKHFDLKFWLETLTVLSMLYYFTGLALRKSENWRAWRSMLAVSGLALGSIISFFALITFKEFGGWFIAAIGGLFIIEMYSRKEGLFEIGAHILIPVALYLILRDLNVDETVYVLLGLSLAWLTLDLIFSGTFKGKRPVEWPAKIAGGIAVLITTLALLTENSTKAAICFAIYTVFFTVYAFVQRKALYGYIPAAYLALTIFFGLDHFKLDAWLPALTILAVLYFGIGLAVRSKEDWSYVLRNSALALGTLISLGALFMFKETGGWYALVAGLLFAAEMYLRRDGRFEIGIPAMFNIGAFLILRDVNIEDISYHLLAYSLVWLLNDLLAHLTFANPRPLQWPVRGIGALLTAINYPILFFSGTAGDASVAAIGFGIYTLFFLPYGLLYRQPTLGYAFTGSLPVFIAFLFREFDITKWIHPVVVIAVSYYAVGYYFRRAKRAAGWDSTLLFSGLGLGVLVSIAAPILGGVDAAIPVAIAATLWAVEAFVQKNAWLVFPANGLYLLAYFIILFELKVDEPQYFSMGAALLGLIQHYLLARAGGKAGAFITGMVSQFILLGTTYIEMVNKNELIYFVVLFFQSLAVLAYGIVIRSRSLTFFPVGFVVLGVVTVIYSALKGIQTVVIIGCTGILLLVLGILAVMMRERITRLGEKLSAWQA